jgi:acetyl/propionyl-CoA carboxylase alpha subunit
VQADAIHPGYGYLSENANFADAVRNAGITFIGPSSSAMSSLGDKRSAKAYLRQHDSSIPLIPGVISSSQDPNELEKSAAEIGYPVMLKASAGGGGKGMRIVRDGSEFSDALQRTQSEAARLFGSSDCILEKYIESGKHIEIQILGDQHGNVISLIERECSIQRRHQKVIEETPSPWIDAKKRQEMCQAAVGVGKLLNYENAGTVEFVFDVDTGNFYFLEVNTRLQVEHPITEETTRLDLVALQIFVAGGGDLSTVAELSPMPQIGHAIECRLCAEDPSRDFYPENGTLRLWRPLIHVMYDLRLALRQDHRCPFTLTR